MKLPGFWRGVALAAGLAAAAAIFVSLFSPVLGIVLSARTLVPALSLAYLAFLLSTSSRRVGRVTAIAAWAGVTVAAWLFVSSFALYLAIHVLLIWLVRSLYFHRSVFAALLDGLLCGAGAAAALWVLQKTGSPLLTVWAFFLCQAAVAVVPRKRGSRFAPAEETADDRFAAAHRRAEAALNQLMTR